MFPYSKLQEIIQRGEPVVLCTIVSTQGSTPRRVGSKMLVYPDGRIEGTIGGGEMESRVVSEALDSLNNGRPRMVHYEMADPGRGDPGVCGGQLEVFVEPIQPPPVLVVVGGGHVGKAVTYLGGWLGFTVVVSDDRTEFCTPESVPGADVYLPYPMETIPDHIPITTQTYFVLCTRNVEVDSMGLPPILKTPAAYIGVIGSRRRWATTRKALLELGVPEDQVNRIRSPMGLELNAETPEEIAISILAEIIMLRRGGHGNVMAEGS